VRLEKFCEVRAADFLLAFDDEREVAGQGSAGFEIGLDSLEMHEVLAFVVHAAAGVNRAALDARRERRRLPQIKRLRRLHVVMAVNHEVRARLAAPKRSGDGRFGDDDGMAGGWVHARLKADLPGVVNEPGGAGAHVLFMLWLGGDAGEAEVIAQFGHEAGLVAFQVIEHGLHGV